MIQSIRISIALLFLVVGINTAANAQCKAEVKEGIKKLSPYKHNGQINNGKLAAGKTAEFHISVYKGLRYRFQIVSETNLGAVQIKVYDENRKEIYNNANGNANFWDFISNASQELIVEITAADKTQKGCVGLVVGMQTPANNSIRNL